MFLKYNPMSQTKSKSSSMCAKKKKVKATKRKYVMLRCVCVCVYLFVGSLKAPLPWLIAWSRLWTSRAITAIIIIIILVISTTIQLPGVLNQLQLEVSYKQNELFMLLDSRLNFEGKVVRTSVGMQGRKVKRTRMKENSPPRCIKEKGSLWHLCYGQQSTPEQSYQGRRHRLTKAREGINKSINSRALLTQVFHLSVTNVQECK